MRRRILVFLLVLMEAAALPSAKPRAEAKSFRLSAQETLIASGFLKYLLPRFSLKHGIRIEVVGEGAGADARLTANGEGTPVFSGPAETWALASSGDGQASEYVAEFERWLTGDIGQATIDAFQVDGKSLFSAALAKPDVQKSVVLPGNAAEGEKLAVIHCGRCHAVNEATRLTTVGSTPSFAVMRGFSDWQRRFEAFFVLNPHPSFTVIDGVTEPFDESRPSPMVPVTVTIEELEAILAFVSRMEPADLGAPIQYQ